jgi:hypothetical protein
MVAVLPPYLQGCLGFPSRYDEERAGVRRSSPLTTHRWHIKLSSPEDLKISGSIRSLNRQTRNRQGSSNRIQFMSHEIFVHF